MQRLCHVGDPLRSVLRYRVRPRGFCRCSDLDPRPRPRPMGSSPAGGGGGGRDPSAKPAVAMLREIVSGGGAADGWEKSWELGVTPWDLGKPTPIVEHLVQSGTLPKGRALVPGCGMGYDVVALASPDRFVVGLDISDIAVKKAKQWSSSLPNVDCFTFLVEDFFSWTPSEKFDLIFDYTFFCAIHPSLRMAWAETVSRLLKPEGELITLIYLISDQDGPPYNNTVADYHEILEPLGFKAVLMEDNALAVKPRKVLGYSTELPQTKTLHVALDGLGEIGEVEEMQIPIIFVRRDTIINALYNIHLL